MNLRNKKEPNQRKRSTKMKKITEYLYGAYGSNLNKDQMTFRCPNAEPLTGYGLDGYTLKFRGVADIERADWNSYVPIGLWRITKKCEKALDRYEGYPDFYTKEFVQTEHGLVMFYVMVDQGTVMPPTSGYLDGIAEGYFDFKLDNKLLKDAITHSYTHQNNLTRWRPEERNLLDV